MLRDIYIRRTGNKAVPYAKQFKGISDESGKKGGSIRTDVLGIRDEIENIGAIETIEPMML